MFKIAFVNPHKFEGIASAAPPINLGFLAAYLRKYAKDLEMKIIDGIAGQNIYAELKKFKPDLVCITSTTPTILDAYQIADWVKEILKVHVIMGGVHVSVMPNEALDHADFVVVGEGEIALLELVEKLSKHEKVDEKIIQRPYIKNLDDVPSPAWDLMDIEFYIQADDNTAKTIAYTSQKVRALTIITSRGCPYKCIFCHNSWRQTPTRYNSAKRVVEDIKYLSEHYDVNSFFFADDEFILNKKRFEEIYEGLKELGLNKKITWGCQARADILLRYGIDYVNTLKYAGCNLVAIGCESGSQKMLNLLKNDSVTVEQNLQAIKLCKKAGLRVAGSFILGTPTETKEDMEETLKFIEKAELDSGGVGIAIPYPGTKLWQMCVERKLIPKDMDYVHFKPNEDPETALIVCDTMSREEFIKIYKKISNKVGETIYYKKVHDNDVSLVKTVWHSFKKRPFYVMTYPIRNPKKTYDLIGKKIKGK